MRCPDSVYSMLHIMKRELSHRTNKHVFRVLYKPSFNVREDQRDGDTNSEKFVELQCGRSFQNHRYDRENTFLFSVVIFSVCVTLTVIFSDVK